MPQRPEASSTSLPRVPSNRIVLRSATLHDRVRAVAPSRISSNTAPKMLRRRILWASAILSSLDHGFSGSWAAESHRSHGLRGNRFLQLVEEAALDQCENMCERNNTLHGIAESGDACLCGFCDLEKCDGDPDCSNSCRYKKRKNPPVTLTLESNDTSMEYVNVTYQGGCSQTIYKADGAEPPNPVFFIKKTEECMADKNEKLNPKVTIVADTGETHELHTSCSQPFYEGMRLGNFTIIGYCIKNEGNVEICSGLYGGGEAGDLCEPAGPGSSAPTTTARPSISSAPSSRPSVQPSTSSSEMPSSQPSSRPSASAAPSKVGCGTRRRELNVIDESRPHRRHISEEGDGLLVRVESQHDERLLWLKDHVVEMQDRTKTRKAARSWDPLFKAYFDNLDDINIECASSEQDVSCTSTGSSQCALDLIQAHASYHNEIAASIEDNGTHNINVEHAIPDSCKK